MAKFITLTQPDGLPIGFNLDQIVRYMPRGRSRTIVITTEDCGNDIGGTEVNEGFDTIETMLGVSPVWAAVLGWTALPPQARDAACRAAESWRATDRAGLAVVVWEAARRAVIEAHFSAALAARGE